MFTVTFVQQSNALAAAGSETVTRAEIEEAIAAIAACADHRTASAAVIDLEEAADLALTVEEVRTLARHAAVLAEFSPRVRVAIAASRDHVFGIARMWQVFAEQSGWQTAVFRTRGEACAWAGIEWPRAAGAKA